MADGDFNAMQANLGLYGNNSSMSPFGIPTPMPQAPQVRHPGEVSQAFSQQGQQASFQTVQATVATRPGAFGGIPTFGSGMVGMGSPGMGGPMGPMGGAIGDYGRQFQQNMAGMNSQLFNPFQAQMMSSMMGQGGFSPGMLPSPIHMTPPSMGIFRPFPPQQPPSIPPVPQMPVIPTPFTPHPVSPFFQTPFEYNNAIGQQRGMQHEAAMLSLPGIGMRAGVDISAAMGGAGLGAWAGAALGGRGGARIGGMLGGLGGMALSEMGGFGAAAQHITDNLNPMRSLSLRTAQMRGMSQDFVVGGSDLAETGRGLSSGASRHLARGLEDVGYNKQFRKETGGAFSVQDLTRITHQAGEQGLLDMQQNSEQLIERVKNIAKALRTFMRVANEPDIREALKQMGQMNAMGLSLPETIKVSNAARTYARMGGTTVKGIMEAGLPGAAMFQQQGLSAGLGFEVGMGAMGMARQAVSSGAYTTQQLAMLGGTSGIAQREMMTQAATLKLPMVAAAMSQMGAGGQFGINPSAVQGLMNGKYDVHQMATMGANNLLNAVNKEGVGGLGTFMMQQREMQDSIGRALGPMGMKVMTMNQVMNTQKLLGLGHSPGGLATAAMAMGMDEDQTRQFMADANSPETFRNTRRQLETERMEARAGAKEGRLGREPSFFAKRALRSTGRLSPIASAYYGAGNLAIQGRDMMEGLGDFFSERDDDAAAMASGQVNVRTASNLLSSSPEQTRRISALRASSYNSIAHELSGYTRQRSREGALFEVGGKTYGRSRGLGTFQDAIMGGAGEDLQQLRNAEGGLAGIFGGGVLEKGARIATAGTDFAEGQDVRDRIQKMSTSARSLGAGLSMSDTERSDVDEELMKQFGGDEATLNRIVDPKARKAAKEAALAKAIAFRGSMENKLADAAKKNTNLIGDNKAMEGEEQAAFAATAKEMGLDPSKMGGLRQKIIEASARGANLKAKMSGATEMKLADGRSVKSEKDFRAAIQDLQDNNKQELFGENDSWTAWGEEKRRDRVMDAIANVDPVVATIAALMAAEDKDGIAKLLAKYPKDKRAQYEGEAGALYEQLKEDKDILAKMGQKLKQFGDPNARKAWVKEHAEKHLTSKGAVQMNEGLSKLMKDKSMLEGAIAPKEVLSKLAGDRQNKAGLTGEAKKLVEKYRKAKTPGERESIENDWAKLSESMGDVGSSNRRGGEHAGAAEGRADMISQTSAEAQLELGKNFPQSVETFQSASKQMLEAAKLLRGLAPDTQFNPMTNNSK